MIWNFLKLFMGVNFNTIFNFNNFIWSTIGAFVLFYYYKETSI